MHYLFLIIFLKIGILIQISVFFYNSYLHMYVHIYIKCFIFLFYSRLYEPLFLQRISCHQITGESLPLNMIDKLKNAKTHLSGYNLCKELYLSHFDLELHSR